MQVISLLRDPRTNCSSFVGWWLGVIGIEVVKYYVLRVRKSVSKISPSPFLREASTEVAEETSVQVLK
jgi:hypothetical protein